MIIKTLKAKKRIAMSFMGRMYARIRHIQKISKLNVEAVQLAIKGAMVCIYLDGVLLVRAAKEHVHSENWDITMTDKFSALMVSNGFSA